MIAVPSLPSPGLFLKLTFSLKLKGNALLFSADFLWQSKNMATNGHRWTSNRPNFLKLGRIKVTFFLERIKNKVAAGGRAQTEAAPWKTPEGRQKIRENPQPKTRLKPGEDRFKML
ncbi:MAG TPA: hypothetical protein ENJ23_00100 [Bacteroidetes bacterium]|nr:hypothetical protein [Bacteroidota bacterium]